MACPVKAVDTTARARVPARAKSARRVGPGPEGGGRGREPEEGEGGQEEGDEQLLAVGEQGPGLERGPRQHPPARGGAAVVTAPACVVREK